MIEALLPVLAVIALGCGDRHCRRRVRDRRRRGGDPGARPAVRARPADRAGHRAGHGRAERRAVVLALPAAGSASICGSPRTLAVGAGRRPIRWRASPPGSTRHALRLAFAGFLLVFAAVIACRTWRGRRSARAAASRSPGAGRSCSALVGGIVSGLFGVGGALDRAAVLTAFFGVRQIEAQALGLALVSPGAIVALAAYAGAGQVDWRARRAAGDRRQCCRSRSASRSPTACPSGGCGWRFAACWSRRRRCSWRGRSRSPNLRHVVTS